MGFLCFYDTGNLQNSNITWFGWRYVFHSWWGFKFLEIHINGLYMAHLNDKALSDIQTDRKKEIESTVFTFACSLSLCSSFIVWLLGDIWLGGISVLCLGDTTGDPLGEMCGDCFGIDFGDNFAAWSVSELDKPSSRRLFFLVVLSNMSNSFLLRNDDPSKLGLSLSLLKNLITIVHHLQDKHCSDNFKHYLFARTNIRNVSFFDSMVYNLSLYSQLFL